jgi:Lrp/AsnC family transcriptional regulator for asnA, asnC and gidA
LDASPEKLIKVLEDLKCMDEVISLYMSSGDHMVLIECWFKDTEELSSFIKKLNNIDGVVKICPAILLEKIK